MYKNLPEAIDIHANYAGEVNFRIIYCFVSLTFETCIRTL